MDDALELPAKRVLEIIKPKDATENLYLNSLPSLSIESGYVIGVGPRHVLVYHPDTTETCACEWEVRDGVPVWGESLPLKDGAPLDGGALPIIEVSEERCFRMDVDMFVYIHDLESKNILYTSRFLRRVGDKLLQYTPRAASYSDAAIVFAASPDNDTSVIGVCLNWRAGNTECRFFECSVPLVSHIACQTDTFFWLCTAIGMATLSVAIPDSRLWAILPATHINKQLEEAPNEMRQMGDCVLISKYLARFTAWHAEYTRDEHEFDGQDIVEVLNARTYPVLHRGMQPVHCCASESTMVFVTDSTVVHVNTDTRTINITRNILEEGFAACAMSDCGIVALTRGADLCALAAGTVDKVLHTPAPNHHTKENFYQLQEVAAAPNSMLGILKNRTLYVNLYQKHIFLFHIS